jgi:hypothetical protein
VSFRSGTVLMQRRSLQPLGGVARPQRDGNAGLGATRVLEEGLGYRHDRLSLFKKG